MKRRTVAKSRKGNAASRWSRPFVVGLERVSNEFFKSDYSANKKGGDDDDDDDETEISSVISDADWRCEWDEDDQQVGKETKKRAKSLEKKWEELQAKYEFRDRVFANATRGKNEAFVRVLREREMAVREAEEELLVLSELYDSQKRNGNRRRGSKRRSFSKANQKKKGKKIGKKNGKSASSDGNDDGKLNVFLSEDKSGERLYDTAVFELNTLIPALLCLLVHTVAHIGYCDGIFTFTTELQKRINPDGLNYANRLYELGLFVLGAWCMWLSGDLFFFLNDGDFDCLKFDYHNQIRLGTLRAKCLKWIRHRNWIRTHVSLIGWNVTYNVIADWYGYAVAWIIDQREYFMEHLPSRGYSHELCLDDRQFPSPFLCSVEMERLSNEESELWYQDMEYTSKYMSIYSESIYWSEWGQSDGITTSPLYGPWAEFLVCVATAILGIFCLRWYGYDFNLRQ